jgi:FMN reductase
MIADVVGFRQLRVVAICGSPSAGSRSRRLLSALLDNFADDPAACTRIQLNDLSADDLLGRTRSRAIAAAIGAVADADIVAVSTPCYQASFSGLLKSFVDLLPQQALAGKVAIGLATGGSAAHQLMLEHSLRPLLASLGAMVVPTLTYAADPQMTDRIDPLIRARLELAAREAITLAATRTRPAAPALMSWG